MDAPISSGREAGKTGCLHTFSEAAKRETIYCEIKLHLGEILQLEHVVKRMIRNSKVTLIWRLQNNPTAIRDNWTEISSCRF